MNVEQAYIKSDRLDEIIKIIKARINSTPDTSGCHPDVGLPSSYDSILATEEKRKVAVSSCVNGWISILESREVNDYKLLLNLSNILESEVLASVFADITGEWGFVEFKNGIVINNYFSEEDDDIEGLITKKLNEKGIKIPMYLFREIVTQKNKDWNIVDRAK